MTKNSSGLRAAVDTQKALTPVGANMVDPWERGETLFVTQCRVSATGIQGKGTTAQNNPGYPDMLPALQRENLRTLKELTAWNFWLEEFDAKQRKGGSVVTVGDSPR